ncbi:uncharacterized protein LY79DRAFT_157434 [Colletotrichum navitas]|uniref:Uncharacterized protein n=1 Tax=Colletotrichum navitas TaxID=681940 RepID=A0AAD8V6L9_9PEZI|nr:uncharacterized protein LY79DRAFT_157434 [Colletotrichum navitas]KAK1594453.1 hypothetical protein LY79DRAFT_157434 [Colletotrichum navitas]
MPDRQPLGDINQNIAPPLRKKMGKKPKPIVHRQYTAKKPIQRIQRSYGRSKQVDVLLYLEHHRYPIDPSCQRQRQRAGDSPLNPANGLRRPTFHEAAAHFGVPFSTVASWYQRRGTIINPTVRSRQPKWLAMEADLYTP